MEDYNVFVITTQPFKLQLWCQAVIMYDCFVFWRLMIALENLSLINAPIELVS